MRRLRQRSITAPRLTTTLLLLIAVVAAAGLCVVDVQAGAHHCGSPSSNLCVGAPGVSLAIAPPAALPVVGSAPMAAPPGVAFSALEVLELPPKL